MHFLGNPLVRIAIGAVAAAYLAPPIVNRAVIPELTPADEARNARVAIVATSTITAGVFVAIGILVGKGAA